MASTSAPATTVPKALNTEMAYSHNTTVVSEPTCVDMAADTALNGVDSVQNQNTAFKTNPPTTTTTSAAQTVFNTYELLEHILALLPPHDIGRLKWVPTVWRDVAKSTAVSPVRCLEPAEVALQGRLDFVRDDLEREEYTDYLWPIVDTTSPHYIPMIRWMHALLGTASICIDSVRYARLVFDITNLQVDALDSAGEQYICEPPVSIVYLKSRPQPAPGATNSSPVLCSIRVQTGITFRDLVAARDHLTAANARFAGQHGVVEISMSVSDSKRWTSGAYSTDVPRSPWDRRDIMGT